MKDTMLATLREQVQQYAIKEAELIKGTGQESARLLARLAEKRQQLAAQEGELTAHVCTYLCSRPHPAPEMMARCCQSGGHLIIELRACLFSLSKCAARVGSATGLHSWCRLPEECLLKRRQKSSQTSAMPGGVPAFLGFCPVCCIGLPPFWGGRAGQGKLKKV